MRQRITQEEFMQKVLNSHRDTNYDYSLTVYKRAHDKVKIICPKHGEFYLYAYELMNGKKCQKCVKEEVKEIKYRGVTTEDFIIRAKEKHGDKYDYSKVEYKNNGTKVCIICPKHGEFWQKPIKHLCGQGCPSCGLKRGAEKQKKTTEKFICQLKEVFGDRYDYSCVEYIKAKVPVRIICPKHGSFMARPDHLLDGHGCPGCKGSLLENTMEQSLRKLGVCYISQYRDKTIFKRQSLDFYLPDYNIAIECQGEQHFNKSFYKTKNCTEEECNNFLKYIQNLDKKKKKICKENNIILIYFLDKRFVKNLEPDDCYFTDVNELLKYIENYGTTN